MATTPVFLPGESHGQRSLADHSPAAAAAKSLQSCPTLCDPVDDSPPGSPVPGILQVNSAVGCHFLLQCMKVKSEREVAQSCPATPQYKIKSYFKITLFHLIYIKHLNTSLIVG